MQNARLDEAKAGIKIVERNINNLRYADDTAFMACPWNTGVPIYTSQPASWNPSGEKTNI